MKLDVMKLMQDAAASAGTVQYLNGAIGGVVLGAETVPCAWCVGLTLASSIIKEIEGEE